MPTCDIVVVGGSAGGVEAMQELVRGLPAGLQASVFMVLHLCPEFPSMMPQILGRAGPLPARHAVDGEPVRPGQILLAPPDHHLLLEDGHVRVTRGPRENRHRPAIDPLFRSAARSYDSRVIGVILSGQLDDGSAGLGAVRAMGGICIVQDPEDADSPQMPQSALQYSTADYVLPVHKIGPQIASLVDSCGRDVVAKKEKNENGKNESNRKTLNKDLNARAETRDGADVKAGTDTPERQTQPNLEASRPDDGEGRPSAFACPECSGVLWELKEGKLVRFRCRVGHSYTMASLAQEQTRAAEDALWAAMRALEEKASLATRMAEATHEARYAQRLREQAQADRTYAETIRKMIFTEDKEPRSVGKSAGKEARSAD